MTEPIDYLELLEELRDRSEVEALLGSYAGELAPRERQLAAAIEHGELAEARRIAHELRSGALNMRASALASCAEAVERAAARGDAEGCRSAAAEVRERSREVLDCIARRRAGGRPCVLYAEDEYTNRRLFELKLRRAGIECDLAEDGPTAVEMFRRKAYNAVILDQYMPGLNGEQVARVIHAIDPAVPLFAVTSDSEGARQLAGAGFTAVYVKPVRGRAIIDRIEALARESTQ